MKEQIAHAVAVLLGKPLWKASRAADVSSFQFGVRRTVWLAGGGSKDVGEIALQAHCAWRLVGPRGVIAGSRDRMDDERVHIFFKERATDPLIVERIRVEEWGDVHAALAYGHGFDLFVDESGGEEQWRLFDPSTRAPHVIVTGRGIVR